MNVERQHKCTVCERCFGSARALSDHKRDRHTAKSAAKSPVVGPKPNGDLLHVGRLRGPRPMGKRRGGGNFPGVIAASSSGVQLPELTHKLTDADRLFVENYLNPCDERMGPSSYSKVPDGCLPNSGVNGFRDEINVEPPFPVPTEPGAIGGPLWSLIVMKLPVIREALYLIATNSRADLSVQDQTNVATAYNTGRFPIFPNWADAVEGQSSIKVTRVIWSQLRNIPNLRNLFKQVRIVKSGYTTYHNAPDLYNQGMVITAQWNLDNSPRGLTSTLATENTGNVQLPLIWTVDSDNFLNGGSFTTPTGTFPFSPEGVPSASTGLSTINIAVSSLGLVGTVALPNARSVSFEVGGLLTAEVETTGQNLNIVLTAVSSTGVVSTATQAVVSTVAGSLQLTWSVLSVRNTESGVDIELPPLDTQTIVQSTPKAVVLPMKQYNGAYSVLRAWEPVFEMQETDNLGPIQWSRRGSSAVTGTSDREQDLVDLNFGTSVQAIMGISLAASVTIKIIQDVEFVAGDDSPWQGFMFPNVNVDPQVIALARAISLDQPFAFPQTYNSMGTLLDGVESLLTHIPIIGNAVPLVSKVVRSLFPSTNSNAPHPELDGDNIAQLVSKLLQALGLSK